MSQVVFGSRSHRGCGKRRAVDELLGARVIGISPSSDAGGEEGVIPGCPAAHRFIRYLAPVVVFHRVDG